MKPSPSILPRISASLLITILLILMINTPVSWAFVNLQRDHYREICPNVESIVRGAVKRKLEETFVTAPGTLRLFFHDCFVEGCDASVLLALPNNNDEKDSSDDISIAGDGFDTVIQAKAAVDNVPGCKHKVSCADVLAMAARDVVFLTGGPFYEVELGRKDGRVSRKTSVKGNIPLTNFNYNQLLNNFAAHGLSQVDLIALSGAHTIGFSHCSFFTDRIYNNAVDPTLNPSYATDLRRICAPGVDPRLVVPMDPISPRKFDNAYYTNILQGKGLFTSDQTLMSSRKSRNVVRHFAKNQTLFGEVFAAAMTRLGRVGVKTEGNGGDGEIRRDCRLLN